MGDDRNGMDWQKRAPRRWVVVALLLAACATSHAPLRNRYGLVVIGDVAEYQRLAAADGDKQLADLAGFVPGILLDVRYATSENFLHEPLYPSTRVLLRRPAALQLQAVQRELATRGLGLKVFDGYRPYRVTERMWERIHNPDFVADPAKGSRHNRGAAVDLTLIDLRTGHELEMPTPFDDFTVRARHDFMALSPEAIANRTMLREVMERHGFAALPSEWWHYDLAGWERFELLDIDLNVDLDTVAPAIPK